jgi:hypothetical protein
MNRKLTWAVLVIGIALVAAPLAMGLPGKSAAGQRMMNGFEPIMQPEQVKTTADYYNYVFVPLGKVTPMLSGANVAKFEGYMQGFSALAKLLPPAAAEQAAPAFRDFGSLMTTMRKNVPVFAQVPAGLQHYKPLVTTMQANVENFKQINSLPDFRLFTPFFVVPGALLILIAGFGLFGAKLQGWITVHRHIHPRPA